MSSLQLSFYKSVGYWMNIGYEETTEWGAKCYGGVGFVRHIK